MVVDEEDIEKVRVESTRVINLEKFTDADAIDDIYLERPYYLAPDGPVAKEAFAVIREGMKGKAGIGKVALYGREYLIKVQPRERGLSCTRCVTRTRSAAWTRSTSSPTCPPNVKPDEVKLAQQVMGTFEGEVDFASYRDEYQAGLREIIDAKIEGPGDRRARSRGAAEGREPDGRASQEPGHDQRSQKKAPVSPFSEESRPAKNRARA